MSESRVPQHKRMATGERVGFKKGGVIRPPINFGPPKNETMPPKTGIPTTPIEKVKRGNGIKGL